MDECISSGERNQSNNVINCTQQLHKKKLTDTPVE